MKIFNFNEFFINESKQVGILYHYTSITSIIQIVKDDLVLKDSVFDRGYVSFTRDGSGISGQGKNYARFVVDGDKLSENIKVVPGSLAWSSGNYARDNEGGILYKTGDKKQAEERVYTKKLDIKPYLISIQIEKDYADFDMSENDRLFIEKKIKPAKLEIITKFKPY